MPEQQPEHDSPAYAWDEEGRLVSSTYGDIYFSRQDGLLESRHVFLRGNGLPERFARCADSGVHCVNDCEAQRLPFVIAEAGFGTGLNFLVTLLAWSDFWCKRVNRGSPGQTLQAAPLVYIAFDQLFLPVHEMLAVHANWPELEAVSSCLLAAMRAAAWEGDVCELHLSLPPTQAAGESAKIPSVILRLIRGDIGETVQRLTEQTMMIDAWYLDGFAPDRNPAMWSQTLFSTMAKTAAASATVATYSCARHVREQLENAGFVWEKAPGFGKKRFMLRATRANDPKDL